MTAKTLATPLPLAHRDRWLHEAIARIEADYQRSADTHLIPLRLPAFAAHGIDLYLKDESTHPTGSLKHSSRGRCFCMRCAMAGSMRVPPLSNPAAAPPR